MRGDGRESVWSEEYHSLACLHKVVQKVRATFLIVRLHHGVLGMNIIVHVISPPRKLFPLFSHALFLLLPLLPSLLILLPQLSVAVLPLLSQIRVLLDPGLVEAVDDRVQPLLDVHPLDLFVVVEGYLTSRHAAILLQIGPGSVDDGDVVFLVAFYRIRFGELSAVVKQGLWYFVPGVSLSHSEVDMGARQIVNVEPDIFVPAMSYQVLVSTSVS